MVAHSCNPNTWEVETGGWCSQSGLHTKFDASLDLTKPDCRRQTKLSKSGDRLTEISWSEEQKESLETAKYVTRIRNLCNDKKQFSRNLK